MSIIKYVSVLLIIVLIVLIIFSYRGKFIGELTSSNGKYTLRYYSSFNPLKMEFSFPGGSSCKPMWIRLYNDDGKKLNQMYTSSCAQENKVTWLEDKVLLPDGETIWPLHRNEEK